MSKPSSKQKKKKKAKKAVKKKLPKVNSVSEKLPKGFTPNPNATGKDEKLRLMAEQRKQFLGFMIDNGNYCIAGSRVNDEGNVHPMLFVDLGMSKNVSAAAIIDCISNINATMFEQAIDVANQMLIPAARERNETMIVDDVLQLIDARTSQILESRRKFREQAKTGDEVDKLLAQKEAVMDSKKPMHTITMNREGDTSGKAEKRTDGTGPPKVKGKEA